MEIDNSLLRNIDQKVIEDLKLKDGESETDYVKRVALLKYQTPFNWSDFSIFVEKISGVRRDESSFRRTANTQMIDKAERSNAENLSNKLFDLKKERFKLADERSQLNVYLRRISREDTLQEIAEKFAEKLNAEKLLEYDPDYTYLAKKSETEAILLISDWHFGLEFKNSINEFSPEICKQRVSRLVQETIRRCYENDVTRLTVLNLSDLIAGRIHTQIRIQSREDVISQTMIVSEILAEMLNKLSENMAVKYYDCLDNHSRIEPDKSASMDLESLARFIPFYLRARLQGKNIQIMDNEFSADIITCEVCGHNVVGVHGDKDKPVTALDKITLMTRKSYDLMCTAHLHHFSADEKCGCITIGNGSLMGTDDYAMQLRLFSTPSQTLIIVTPQNVCEAIYKINLE